MGLARVNRASAKEARGNTPRPLFLTIQTAPFPLDL